MNKYTQNLNNNLGAVCYYNVETQQNERNEITESLRRFCEVPLMTQDTIEEFSNVKDFTYNGYTIDEPQLNEKIPLFMENLRQIKQPKWKCTRKIAKQFCVFCKNNNEPEAVVQSHAVRDAFKRVLCPKLRTYICPICGASGDTAHTVKYCPKRRIVTMEDTIAAENMRLSNLYFKSGLKI